MPLPNENITISAEEIARHVSHADHHTPEDEKVRFLMGGVKEQLFAGLKRNPPRTVAEFVSEATAMEKTLEMCNRHYNHRLLTKNCAEDQALGPDDLHEIIAAVVREELPKFWPRSQPQVASVADRVNEEIRGHWKYQKFLHRRNPSRKR